MTNRVNIKGHNNSKETPAGLASDRGQRKPGCSPDSRLGTGIIRDAAATLKAVRMTCQHSNFTKHGKTSSGAERLRCRDCGLTFTPGTALLDGMRIGLERAEAIVSLLCEGASVRATSRLTRTDEETVLDLLVLIGNRCKRFLEAELVGVVVTDVQVDEVWQFIYCKQKTAAAKGWTDGDVGDSYCFTAIERNTKLAICWHFGHRTQEDTDLFAEKLRDATSPRRFQISTDGYVTYSTAIPTQLGGKCDYGQVIKTFGSPSEDEQRKYSPAKITGIRKEVVWGQPNEDKICTSHTERANGTMRNFIKRMCRLTYCFSKKWENHEAALGLYFVAYNFLKPHRSLHGETPWRPG